MGQIHLLSSELSNQIAAGEVVERPASVLKELIENSLDASATRCDIEIEGGGVTRIALRDDGQGMSPDDAQLCIARHATSKLRAFSDLEQLSTYGFRGEALASIASVSQFVLRTRQPDSDQGTEVRVERDNPPQLRPVGTPIGTYVEVRQLFGNVPARRKFLRASGTESGHAIAVVEAAALSRPDVTFTVKRDGRSVREWLRATSRAERVNDVLRSEELLECGGERGPLKLQAFLSAPERARSGAGGLKILVNDRIVSDRSIAVAVAQAYGSVLERGRYPRGVVYLELPSQLVDVNVHPQKTEVRFADPRAVSGAVYSILSNTLARSFGIERDAAEAASPEPATDEVARASGARNDYHAPSRVSQPSLLAQDASIRNTSWQDGSRPLGPPPARSSSEASRLRFVCQLRRTYLLCEANEGLYIIDQHAAAERVNFDRLYKQHQSEHVVAQNLLFPVSVEVTPEQMEWIEQNTEVLDRLGLEVRARAENLVSVHTMPRLLTHARPEQLLGDVLSELCNRQGREFSAAVEFVLATVACHGSLRAGDDVSAEEADALLAALDQVDFSGHCPHGRPILKHLTWTELERSVGRR